MLVWACLVLLLGKNIVNDEKEGSYLNLIMTLAVFLLNCKFKGVRSSQTKYNLCIIKLSKGG
ncbi:hypothetical protein MTP04_38220 [Lysinibacillus sp. PLM2]|nr:hypothetical protein MTP04_38220 [Lysinibacillus sp. PLM2]